MGYEGRAHRHLRKKIGFLEEVTFKTLKDEKEPIM